MTVIQMISALSSQMLNYIVSVELKMLVLLLGYSKGISHHMLYKSPYLSDCRQVIKSDNYSFNWVQITSYDVKKNTHPPTFDNVIPLKLLKLDKILPYKKKAQDYITSPQHYDFFGGLI